MGQYANQTVALIKVYLDGEPNFVMGIRGGRPLTEVVGSCHSLLLSNPGVRGEPELAKMKAKSNLSREIYLELYFQQHIDWIIELPNVTIH